VKQHLVNVLWACAAVIPTAFAAQAPAPAGTQSQAVAPVRSNNSRGFPAPAMVNGQPIETRTPEKSDDKPAFPGQTRAPYQATAPFAVTTLTDKLSRPWSLAFLPDASRIGGIPRA